MLKEYGLEITNDYARMSLDAETDIQSKGVIVNVRELLNDLPHTSV